MHVKRRKDALAAVEATAREAGFTLAELMGKPEKAGKKISPPKYSHPENPELTWTGRGRQPAWFKELIAGGTPPDELEI